MKQNFSDYSHVKRLAIVVALGFGITLTLRAIMVPKTFGEMGRYRAVAIDEVRSRTPQHAGKAACLDCHEKPGWETGKHSSMSCESCHEPMAAHADEQTTENSTTHFENKDCLSCHEKSDARNPDVIRQVVQKDHHLNKSCFGCHDAHNPAKSPGPKKEK